MKMNFLLQSANGVDNVEAAYALLLEGNLDGDEPGTLGDGKVYTVEAVVLHPKQNEPAVVRAILARPFEIPSGLLKKSGDVLEFKTKDKIQEELAALAKDVRARIADDFRRLGTIEAKWDEEIYLGAKAANVEAAGQVKLGLTHKTGPIDGFVGINALAEFRAVLNVNVDVTTSTGTVAVKRHYGIVCRIELDAAVTLSFDLDDLNLSLPHVKLPRIDLKTLTRVKFDGGTMAASVAGAFAQFIQQNLKVEYKWSDPPRLVVKHDSGELLLAIAADDAYDLSRAPMPAELAKLEASITHPDDAGFEIEAKGVTFARFKDSGTVKTQVQGSVTAGTELKIKDDERRFGPLRVAWTGLKVHASTKAIPVEDSPNPEPDDASVRAIVTVDRLLIHPIDDPTSVLAVAGSIEVNPSGVRILELRLVEPYPFVLVEKGARALLRGLQKILQLLARIKPKSSGDIEGLKRLLQVLGRIAAAIARAVAFVGEKIATVAIKLAELVVELLKKLAELVPDFDGAQPDRIALDVEVRIGLDPLEFRQVMLTSHDSQGNAGKKLSALGVDLLLPETGPLALLFDFVSEPGAYLVVAGPVPKRLDINDELKQKPRVAQISTDLWLKRPDGAATPMRDAAGKNGERDDDPLLQLHVLQTAEAERLLLVLAGVSRGKAVFFRAARDPVKKDLKKVDLPDGTEVSVLDAPFVLQPLQEVFEVAITVNKGRVLPLLGMGEPGKSAASSGPNEPASFLEKLKSTLGQVVTVEGFTPPKLETDHGKTSVHGAMKLGIKAAGVSTSIALDFSLDESLELTLRSANNLFPLRSKRIQDRALGLTWVVEQTDPKKLKDDEEVEMFALGFAGGESVFQLDRRNAHMELRFDGLSADGQGLVFDVSELQVGRGGLDLVATVRDSAVKLNGLDVPFRFAGGRLEIRGGKFVGGAITARGQLPPDLVGEATLTAAFVFGFENEEIVLKSGKVELDKKGEPIVCHATRFTLTITNLDLAFVRENGYHFYFLVTGSLRFTPKEGEFEDGLLKHLADLEISLERAPLTGDARVLLRHVSFQKALNPKKTFDLFNLFTFELRAFGFHPSSPKFEGRPPAIDISGQIRLAETGDVIQPKIDFHELWIAPPKKDECLPRIKADGLGVELQLAGSVKIRGAVLAVDPNTRTVEGREFAPDGYDAYGFLGEGAVDIPGFASLEARLGFLEVEKQDQPGDRKIAFFLYLQANKLAVKIPTPVWTFYLREAGFGFGYRYTLAGIKEAEKAKSAAQLVKVLDDVSRRQGDLSRFTAWLPDPEKDNFTLALRGAFQMFPAKDEYVEKEEKDAVNPLFFDIVAALRSDFTFLLSARGWVGVNYATFLANANNFRDQPTLRGFLYISVPRSELLLRGIGDAAGHIGPDWPEVAKDTQLRKALESVNWTTTLYIRPGLFHFELGWPDQLSVELVKNENMSVVVRGGMIFRAWDEGLLFGFNIQADAFLHFEGRAGESIGVAVVANLTARLIARVLAFLAAGFRGSLVYGLVSLDARLTFSVHAWMEVDLGFTSFTINIGFSFSVQFTAAVELAIVAGDGVGGRVNAQISVQVFGCNLGVGIGFSFNNAKLDAARARVERFLALSITSEEPDAPPVFAATKADKVIDKSAAAAEVVNKPKPMEVVSDNKTNPNLKPSKTRPGGRPIRATDFWLVLRKAVRAPKGAEITSSEKNFAYALLVPKEAVSLDRAGFYAAAFRKENNALNDISHTVEASSALSETQHLNPTNREWTGFTEKVLQVKTRWTSSISVPDIETGLTFTLDNFFDECFITDTEWIEAGGKKQRIGKNQREPATLREHRLGVPLSGSRDDRNQQRHQQQVARAAEAIESPFDERAYQARSTLLTMFLDQFVTLAETGIPPKNDDPNVHVADLGLLFYGPATELAKLAKVIKHEDSEKPGDVQVLNPHALWFEEQDPVLANETQSVEVDGIKLDWQLTMEVHGVDGEHFLHHYEVLRTIDAPSAGIQDEPFRVKPAATIGERPDKKKARIRLIRPDWQFVDRLDDKAISETVRRALLPTFGDADGLEAAKAWLAAFPGDESVTITYTVTPIDIAGTRALPRGFAIRVRRPQPSIRPAIGELRMVQKLRSGGTSDTGAQRIVAPPGDLDVYLAFKDDAWTRDPKITETFGKIDYTIERLYRIVADPEKLEPAGHYGSDATSSRLRGPGALGVTKTADEKTFAVPRLRTVEGKQHPFLTTTTPARRAIADEDELDKLPRWSHLNGQHLGNEPGVEDPSKLLQFLWRGSSDENNPTRVATRFSLETIIRISKNGSNKPLLELVSKRVPLPVSHIIDASALNNARHQPDAILRPEAFEWAAPLMFPPLASGQIRTESGFARFRIPRSDARLADLLDDSTKALRLERDPARRILTTVRFAAVPDWVTADPSGSTKPHPSHGTSIAGYELHELDLDDLAPLDVKPAALQNNVAWERSRRVALIEHLSREDAQLVPSGNPDWQGWEAHYPSETERITSARIQGKDGEAKPILSAWYSDRESTPHFAERRPRLRFFPLPPESEIAELMRGGLPQRVNVSVIGGTEAAPFGKLDPLDSAALHELLTSIEWNPSDAYVARWTADKQAFNGMKLILEASVERDHGFVITGTASLSLDVQAADPDDATRPRRRLLPASDNAVVTSLLQGGIPTRVVARLFAPVASKARATHEAVHPGMNDADKGLIGQHIPLGFHSAKLRHRVHALDDMLVIGGTKPILRHPVTVTSGKASLQLHKRFSPTAPFVKVDAIGEVELRELLRSIEWDPSDAYIAKWTANKQAFEGLTLVLEASVEKNQGFVVTGSATLALDVQEADEDAAARPRRRLLRTVADTTIASLLQGGTPTRVVARLFASAGSKARTTDEGVNPGMSDADKEQIGKRIPLVLRSAELPLVGHGFNDVQEFALTKRTRSDLRDLLRTLEWGAFEEDDRYLAGWRADVKALDGLRLVVEGKGTADIALDTREIEPNANRPRRRFLVDDAVIASAIASVTSGGIPASVTVRLVAAEGTTAHKTDKEVRDPRTPDDEKERIGFRLPRPVVRRSSIDQRREAGSDRNVFHNVAKPFTTSDLRHLLLCLGWGPFPDNETVLEGLKLVVEASHQPGGTGAAVLTGRAEIPLDFRSVLHPALEEALAELAFDLRPGNIVYRRYNVLPQPVTPISAKNLAAFMAATAPETDPYGWQILQLLGAAVTVRVYDRAEERFLKPKELAQHVANVLQHSVLARWGTVYDETVLGQPFTDVFLRPGANRLAGPFDSVLTEALEIEGTTLDLDDEGLAFVQLSLRPRTVAAWRYERQSIAWKTPKDIQKRAVSFDIQANGVAIDAARERSGDIVTIAGDATERIVIPESEVGGELALIFRIPVGAPLPTVQLFLDGESKVLTDFAKVEFKRIVEPAKATPDPFVRFKAVPPDRWATAFVENADARRAIDALRAVMKASGAKEFEFPTPAVTSYQTAMGAYLPWVQRFLDHGAATGGAAQPHFAIAAPTKAAPWKLASDANGFITLNFLHADRWAHARAYAVRPLSRYHELLGGLGVPAQKTASGFDKKMPEIAGMANREIGYAVAVSPRTERIEPPVILQSRIAGLKNPHQFANEIIVARHGEESLAMSNRPLFARLGMPASLIAFVRDYRPGKWPERLHRALEKGDQAPEKPATLKPRTATMPQRPTGADPAAVTAEVIAPLAHDVPSLWKGADILRVAPLPPHYRLTAFASERAGIVVSEVVTLIADEQPREPLAATGPGVLKGKSKLALVRAGDGVRLVFEHPLVSHRHLTPANAEGWLTNDNDDVCFWPDPDVTYRISRRAMVEKKAASVEEDADVKLVNLENETRPLAVRALGPMYREVPGSAFVRSSTASGPRTFTLVHALQLHATPPPRHAELERDEFGNFTTDINALNTTANKYAVILTPHVATIDVVPNGGETGADYIKRAGGLLDTFLAVREPWLEGPPFEELRSKVAAIRKLLASADPALPAAQIRTDVGFPATVKSRWRRGFTAPGATFAEVPLGDLDAQKPGILLAVYGVATEAELTTLRSVCSAKVAAIGGRLGHMSAALAAHRQAVKPPGREALEAADYGDYVSDIPKFNEAAHLFATILTPHRFSFDVDPIGVEPGTTYIPRAQAALAKLLASIKTNLEPVQQPWLDGVFPRQLRRRVEQLDEFFKSANTALTSKQLRELVELPLKIETAWLRDFKVDGIDLVEKKAAEITDPKATGVVLVVRDIAADKEVEDVAAKCPAPVAKGRLRSMLKCRLLGEGSNSIWLTATDVRMRIKVQGNPERERVSLAETGNFASDITTFNEKAKAFAAIVTPHRVPIDIPPLTNEKGTDYTPRARAVLAGLQTTIRENLVTLQKPWLDGLLAPQLSRRVEELIQFFATANDQLSGAELHKAAKLPTEIDTLWLRGFPVRGLTFVELSPDVLDPKSPGVVLVVWDAAAKADVDAVAAACPAPIAQKDGRLQRILDRMGITFVDGKPVRTPGVAEVRIDPEPWLKALLVREEGDES